MSLATFALLCVAGGVGAALRFVIDGLVKARVRSGLPLGTMLINLTGCLALGVLTGLAQSGPITADWLSVVGTGMLGGYTTFSTASYETAVLLREGRRGAGVLVGLGTALGGIALAWFGLWLGLR